ncbi:MAG: heme ABC transporter permease [Xanthomonadales bacterium]|nr:heme ABC transporter permease [Xanthomonadales bacterium]
MNAFIRWIHRTGSPEYFYQLSGKLVPWFAAGFLLLLAWGLYGGLFTAPADYQQGDSYRIIFIHVPSAWMSLFIYIAMTATGIIGLVWRIKVAEIVAMASAPIGAAFTAVTLVTGSLWGKPMWGAYWVWDARLTSELILLFIYLGIIGLYQAVEDRRRAARAASLLAVVGLVNIPIIHFSVEWWNTLHQGQTVKLMGESAIHPSMLTPLLVMAVATKFFYAMNVLQRARTMLLEQESRKNWVRRIVEAK